MSFADIVNHQIVPLFNDALIPLMYVFAFLFFIVGVVKFFFFGGEEQRKEGRAFVMWGIIGFAVIFSVWGFVRLLLSVIPGTSV